MKKTISILMAALLMGSASATAQNKDSVLFEALADTQRVAVAPMEQVDRMPVVFVQKENGFHLAGILFRPVNRKPGEKLKAIIVDGPMYSVKEQPQSLYAQILASKGYATLVFDHSYIGSSEGHPRGYEDPEIKGADERAAVDFLVSQPDIDANHIGAVGICGGGVYVPNGLRNDRRVKAIASVVPFIMMQDVRTASDEELRALEEEYKRSGKVARLDLIHGSEGEAYYRNPNRGAALQNIPTPAWSQLEWHKFHPQERVKELKVPYLVIAGERAFTLQSAKTMYDNAPQPKYWHLTKGASHFEMYDIDKYVKENTNVILDFFAKNL
jgi:fermentation-respiration switch protein FrsA (DUF1100 family)